MTRDLWIKLINPLHRRKFFDSDIKHWVQGNLCDRDVNNREDWSAMFSIICWFLWKRRNNRIFTGKWDRNEIILQKTNAILAYAGAEIKDNMNGWAMKAGKDRHHGGWKKPHLGWFKLNTDGACSLVDGQSGCGGLCRDDQGKFAFGFMHNLGKANSLTAELWGCLHGLKMAWDNGIRKVVLETDSIEVIDLLENNLDSNHAEAELIHEIKLLMERH